MQNTEAAGEGVREYARLYESTIWGMDAGLSMTQGANTDYTTVHMECPVNRINAISSPERWNPTSICAQAMPFFTKGTDGYGRF